ncbi:tryptophan-tRNA ligase [Vittaforma corneae ATCC 50505]|uniref:tryptophan--tRNA ligase n=1 Tax=Vittaforma corneae (strain ATCC 50505) TaxID=993615 RepID=L2GKT2_VITCO|nr:tryptophan-tRNA ligase [Vittaforma corneae ATCC 50505]ELA41090.1 tryptophan-tRNA ligase [Vittaforma corneae ATCC 50505]
MTEQKITPWTVEAEKDGEKMTTINYDKIISQFGCEKCTQGLFREFQEATGKPLHRFLRRDLAFAHRDFEKVIECAKKNEEFFIYTGRGPSSESMHLGHAMPFIFCKYLQDTFGAPLVIQITDDEKFLCKNITLDNSREYGRNNIKDIIAFGFDPDLTYIFSNFESSHVFMENILKTSKSISLNEAMKVFGFDESTNIGMIDFPSKQIAAGFSSSYPFLKKNMLCLIPCAVDQDPFFRLARDKCKALGERKPASLYLGLLPDLQGTNRKMSASDQKSAIFLNDGPNDVENKINKLAFSGGKETVEEHRRLGGDPSIDVAYQYLRYFLEDDEELLRLKEGYEKGAILSGEMKAYCIRVVQQFLEEYQRRRSEVTDEVVEQFKSLDKFKANLNEKLSKFKI